MTMNAELALNLVWLAVAVGAAVRLAVWCLRQPPQTRLLPVIVATACIVAMLFPIISETDDLATGFVLTETNALRRMVALVNVAVTVAALVDAPAFFRSFVLQFALLTVVPVFAGVVRRGFSTVFSFRGPPAAALR